MNDRIKLYTESAVDRLKDRLKSKDIIKTYCRKVEYYKPEDQQLMESSIEPNNNPPNLVKTEKKPPKTDKNNAILVYKFLGDMDRVTASDDRLWVYLTHQTFWNYVQWRWNVNMKDENPEDKIETRWFTSGTGLEALGRNALARLWWGAHLTKSPWKKSKNLEQFRKQDDFHYTKVLFRTQQVHQSIMERGYGSSDKLRISMLDIIDRYTSEGPVDDFVRAFSKRVNIIATHRELQTLKTEKLLEQLEGIAPE